MAGGLMQLVKPDSTKSNGAQMEYITGNPEISYFKMVFRRFTNFSMESVRQTFLTKPVIEGRNHATFTCRIGRVADLLKEVYLCFELPDIYSDSNLRFQWIENLAHHMIYSYSVRVDTQLIDQQWGEFMDVWTELSLPPAKRGLYDRMTGHVDAFSSPTAQNKKLVLSNNRIGFNAYPTSAPGRPSIKGRKFYVPLNFFFTKHSGLALPLIALQYQTVDITIEFRGAEELYQIYDASIKKYVSPTYYNQTHGTNYNIANFLSHNGVADPTLATSESRSIDLNAYLECNYIYLDTEERTALARNSTDYLVERVFRIERTGLVGTTSIELTLQNPVKELLWITRRSDAISKYNEYTNYMDTVQELEAKPILRTAKIIWNGMDRIEEKDADYFNLLVPYQHHTNSPRDGVYVYSFSIAPEKIQPSGVFNASMINDINLFVTLHPRQDSNYEHEIVVYSLYYNIFRVMSGSGAMVFAN